MTGPPTEGPLKISETGILRIQRAIAINVRRRSWTEHSFILVVILATAAITAEVIPPGPWAKMAQGVIAGLYAWGYVQRPGNGKS